MRAGGLAFLCLAAPARADFSDGLAAFDAGDYRAAAREWRPLAEAGDAEAQVALAGLYAAGNGVPRSLGTALRWYQRAARQGHAVGQLNAGEYYARGWGVPRNRILAYVWLSLAAAQGRDWAAAYRNEVAAKMTAEELAAAKSRLAVRSPGAVR